MSYYNALDVRTTLSGLLPSGWSVLYDKKTNKFTFVRANTLTTWYKFVFNNSLYEVLGFNEGEQPIFTIAAPTVVSTVPIRVSEENAVIIHTDIARRKFSSIDNHDTVNKNFKEATILAKIPIEAPPYDNIIYHIQEPIFMYDLTADSLTTVRVWITDENERKLQLPFDWSMALKFDFIPNASNNDPIMEVRDLLKLMVLSSKKIMSQ